MGRSRFHVTLVRPPAIWIADTVRYSSVVPPLGMAYLSAVLREGGFSLTNVDAVGEAISNFYRLQRSPGMEAQGLPPDEIIARIPADTDLIGVSCIFSSEWPATRDLINAIREARPGIPIVIGGEHATALPEFSMNECPAIDYLVLGEGERILLDLTRALSEGRPVSGIPGLLYRVRGRPVRGIPDPGRNLDGTSGARIKDLERLPLPAWELLPLKRYFEAKQSSGRYVGRTLSMLASRGCPYECTFCSNPKMWGTRYLSRNPKDVVSEILHFKKIYDIDAVEFRDLTMIMSKKWIVEFSEELIRANAGVRWQIPAGTRCEAIDEEVILKLKESGCIYLGFAPESGVQEILDQIKKRLKLAPMQRLMKLSRRHGLSTRCNFIIGFPSETRLQIWRTMLFQLKLAFIGVSDSALVSFTPYPGSELFEQLRADGTIDRLDDEYFETLGRDFKRAERRRRYCRAVGPSELSFYHFLAILLFYAVTFLRRPLDLWSLLKNLVVLKETRTAFEHRIVLHLRRKGSLLSPFRRSEARSGARGP